MGSHPINLGIRFLLEITALVSIGMWGYRQGDGGLRYVLAFGLPIIIAAIWGTFAVPNDPSRSGEAPIATLGIIRLIIELGFFAFATWSLYDMNFHKASVAFGIIVLLHYIISYDRVIWLISQ
ncbi:MAG: YrdB family protein [Chitinophagales bacterium]